MLKFPWGEKVRPIRVGEKASTALLCLVFTCLATPLPAQNSGPERDAWQHPDQVMDALGIHAGSTVADIGCGRGYFTFEFAKRVGTEGKVYAEDLDQGDLASIRNKAKERGLTQIEAVLGATDDPHLPAASLDAVLIMNAYHEFQNHDPMLQAIYRALKPGGLLGLIDGAAEVGHPRSYYDGTHRLPEVYEREDALRAGFHFVRQAPSFKRTDDGKEFYFLIFEKPTP